MKFRPCIDIHNGMVKQIIGGSLKDEMNQAIDNFVSEQDACMVRYGLSKGALMVPGTATPGEMEQVILDKKKLAEFPDLSSITFRIEENS